MRIVFAGTPEFAAAALSASGQVGYMDCGAGNYPRRFYRAVQLP